MNKNRVLVLSNDVALERLSGKVVRMETLHFNEFMNDIVNTFDWNNTEYITYDNYLTNFLTIRLNIKKDIEYKNIEIKKNDIIIGTHNDNDTYYTIFIVEE